MTFFLIINDHNIIINDHNITIILFIILFYFILGVEFLKIKKKRIISITLFLYLSVLFIYLLFIYLFKLYLLFIYLMVYHFLFLLKFYYK